MTARPLTDAQLRRQAELLEARATEMEGEAAFLRRQARLILDRLVERESLHSVNGSRTVVDSMEMDHRIALSASLKPDKDKFSKACRAAGHTATTLAKALGIDKTTLSRYRSGDRKTPLDVREHAAKLIGWPVDSWPLRTD